MKTDEVLILQALKFKQLHTQGTEISGDLIGNLIDKSPELKEKMRNICAFISPQLFEEIEGLCGMLELSKRQFVEMALNDMVGKAKATIAQFDALPADQEG